MSRGRSRTSDSLDLLLDTICNTFGSILFLSLLIVLMVQYRSQQVVPSPPTAEAELQLARLQDQIQQWEIRRRNLHQVLRQSRGFSPSETPTVELHQWRQLRQREKQAEEQNARLARQILSLQQAMNRLARQLVEAEKDLQRQEETVQAMREKLEQQIDKQTRELRLPRLRVTSKSQVALFLYARKLFVCHRVVQRGTTRELENSDECTLAFRDGARVVLPRPEKGMTISAKDPDLSAIGEKLRPFQPQSEYLKVFVWEDSFDQWPPLHQVIEQLGFDYQVVPLEEGALVGIGAGPRLAQ